MSPKRRYIFPVIVFLLLICFMSSCGQRFWFRKKVNMEQDTTEREKDFKIVW